MPRLDSRNPPCFHCGQTMPEGIRLYAEVAGAPQPMCCHGCKAAAETIIRIAACRVMACSLDRNEEPFDELIRLLREGGHISASEEFDFMVNHMAWTTGSEFLGELGLKLWAFRKTGPRMSPELKKHLKTCFRRCGLLWGYLPW